MVKPFSGVPQMEAGKIHNFPIILFSSAYWSGLLTWLRSTILAEGKISAAALDLITLCDMSPLPLVTLSEG